jgi:hypothetical protein
LKDSLGVDDDFGSETAFSFDFGSDIQIPILKDPTDANAKLREDETSPAPTKSHLRGKAMKHLVSGTDKDVAAYKRVIWEDINEYEFHLVAYHGFSVQSFTHVVMQSRNFRASSRE